MSVIAFPLNALYNNLHTIVRISSSSIIHIYDYIFSVAGSVIGLTIGMLLLGLLLGIVTINLVMSRKHGVSLFQKSRFGGSKGALNESSMWCKTSTFSVNTFVKCI